MADPFVNEHVVHRQRFYALHIFKKLPLLSGFSRQLKLAHTRTMELFHDERRSKFMTLVIFNKRKCSIIIGGVPKNIL